MISRITRIYIRTYRDSGQRKLYVEWVDARGRAGRTEGDAERSVASEHMRALVARGEREGLTLEHEVW